MKHYIKKVEHLIVVRNGNFGGPIAELTSVGRAQMDFVGRTIVKPIILRYLESGLASMVSVMCPQQNCFVQSAEIVSNAIGLFDSNSVKSFQTWPRVDSGLCNEDANQKINSAVMEFGNTFTILVLSHRIGEDYCKYFMKHYDIKSYKNLDVSSSDHGFVIWVNVKEKLFCTFGVPNNHAVAATVAEKTQV